MSESEGAAANHTPNTVLLEMVKTSNVMVQQFLKHTRARFISKANADVVSYAMVHKGCRCLSLIHNWYTQKDIGTVSALLSL